MNQSKVKIGIVQMQSGASLTDNLKKMEAFVQKAHALNCQMLSFPEMAYLMVKPTHLRSALLEVHRLEKTFSHWAKKYSMYLLPGTVRIPFEGIRHYNQAWVFGPQGEKISSYSKIHLFRAHLPDRNYDESLITVAGHQTVTFSTPWGEMGLAICFDLRFPEIFSQLRAQGARVIFVPSAFTVPTGIAHWEILVRARAIETQTYLVCPDLCGIAGDGRENYGHSMVVSPWGEVLAQLGQKEGIQSVELDFDLLQKRRQEIIMG